MLAGLTWRKANTWANTRRIDVNVIIVDQPAARDEKSMRNNLFMELCGGSDQLMTPWVVLAITFSFLFIQKFIIVVPVKKLLFAHKS